MQFLPSHFLYTWHTPLTQNTWESCSENICIDTDLELKPQRKAVMQTFLQCHSLFYEAGIYQALQCQSLWNSHFLSHAQLLYTVFLQAYFLSHSHLSSAWMSIFVQAPAKMRRKNWENAPAVWHGRYRTSTQRKYLPSSLHQLPFFHLYMVVSIAEFCPLLSSLSILLSNTSFAPFF